MCIKTSLVDHVIWISVFRGLGLIINIKDGHVITSMQTNISIVPSIHVSLYLACSLITPVGLCVIYHT